MSRLVVLVWSIVILMTSVTSCGQTVTDEELVRRSAEGPGNYGLLIAIDRKYESRYGNIYFARSTGRGSLEPDTVIGLVGVTGPVKHRFAFLYWAFSVKEFHGTELYLNALRTDSLSRSIGEGEWWKDSAFWSDAVQLLNEQDKVY